MVLAIWLGVEGTMEQDVTQIGRILPELFPLLASRRHYLHDLMVALYMHLCIYLSLSYLIIFALNILPSLPSYPAHYHRTNIADAY